jgi:hypothetical protein
MFGKKKPSQPSEEFCYPGGERMCQSGKVRAADWSQEILTGQMSVEQIEQMARRGETADRQGANTNKKNLIAMMVYRHARNGDLENYATPEGDFLSNGNVLNVNDPKFKSLRKDLRNKGGDSS